MTAEERRAYKARWRAARRAAGLCGDCPAAGDPIYCRACAEKRRQARARYHARQRNSGALRKKAGPPNDWRINRLLEQLEEDGEL